MKVIFTLLLVCCLLNFACVRNKKATNTPPAPTTATPHIVTTIAVEQESTAQQTWQIQTGLLRKQLESWAMQAGYQLVWKVSRDYYLQSHATFEGTLAQALQALFVGLQQRGHALRVVVYQGNNVILVSEE